MARITKPLTNTEVKQAKQKTKEYQKEYRLNNKDKLNKSNKENFSYNRINLTDSYIANFLFKLPLKKVPKELIELKRIQIKIKRFTT